MWKRPKANVKWEFTQLHNSKVYAPQAGMRKLPGSNAEVVEARKMVWQGEQALPRIEIS